MANNTTGSSNVGIGTFAGIGNSTGSNNTFVGYFSGVTTYSLTFTNVTAIGNGAIATANNRMMFGNSSVTGLYTTGGIFATSDGRFKTNITENVKGLAFINKLRPVTYNLDTKKLDDYLIQNMPDSIKARHKEGMDFTETTTMVHSGFIAQEVEQAAKEVGFISSIVSKPSNSTDPYALSYSEIVVPLVKAIQELSKTADSTKTASTKKDSINTAMLQAMQNKINQMDSIINSHYTNPTGKSMQENPDSQTAANQTNVELSNKNIIVLDQNVPNPFAEQTIINYFLPDNITRAQIIFLDQSGKLIKAVDLTGKGKGQLNVFANDLTNGIYTYSLIVDGQTMETKKMMKAQ